MYTHVHPNFLPTSATPPDGPLPKAGDIWSVNMSVYEPYSRLLERLSQSPNNDDGTCILRSPIQTSPKGFRPCIVLDILPNDLVSICLMATFDRNYSQVPRCFDPFLIPVFTHGASNEGTEYYLHTSPEWNGTAPQMLVAIPFRCRVSMLLKPWKSSTGGGYVVEDLDVLKSTVATRMENWREYISTNTERRIEQYYEYLITHKRNYIKWKRSFSGSEPGLTTASSHKRSQHRVSSICTASVSTDVQPMHERDADGGDFTVVKYGSAWNRFVSKSRVSSLKSRKAH
ncbi:hypothetical protein L218DRAFT_1079596 [Marasmius fiardii PR-910]|nr:hypothetical protein L218DRAFT_1079596 [Marasmius fiardii PR-910]